MLKVVVADDELHVCQLICNLVDWHSFDMDIVGVAHNGVETLELIRTYEPHLVVTDIRMPGYDGLEMVAKARELQEELDFIIISGYRHFEYAQYAVRYGVYDYLLKPIKKEELCAALQKMKDKHDKKRMQVSQEEQRQQKLKSDMERLRSGLIRDLRANRVSAEHVTLDSVNTDYYFHFQQGSFQVLVAKFDGLSEEYLSSAAAALLGKMVKRLSALLEPDCFDVQVSEAEGRVYGILNFDESCRGVVRRDIKLALDEFLLQVSVFEGVELTMGLGEPVREIGCLPQSLAAAEYTLGQRILEGTGCLLEGAPPDSRPDMGQVLAEFQKDMEFSVKALDQDMLSRTLDAFRARCLAVQGRSGAALQTLVLRAYRSALSFLSEQYIPVDALEDKVNAFSRRVDACSLVNTLFDLLKQELTKTFSALVGELRQIEKKPVRVAKQYIQENFAKQITLEEISSIVGFNPSYFSTLFKKESGRNFLEYLSEVRMDHAKALLKDTNKTVASICGHVGYSDQKHFTQSFKKYTGLNPNEYRKLFS